MLKRLLNFEKAKDKSFFLWGQRQTGKSYLLHEQFKNAVYIDLLKSDLFAKYSSKPFLLREELLAANPKGHVVIDEIQKIPILLDEVHWLIENKKLKFALCGSSARKLRREHANLLGGRALRFELFGFVSDELKSDFNLQTILNRGYLPPHYLSEDYIDLLRSYIGDYLRDEIATEGVVRAIPTFARFLDSASLGDTEIISLSSFGRDCGVSPNTIKEYYQILVDTLIGCYVEAYTGKTKRRIVQTPKFYFHDVGIVNLLAKRGFIEQGSYNFGKAFENWVFHELNSYRAYSRKYFDISYWQLSKVTEVDFILGSMNVGIEAKGSSNITSDHLAGIRSLASEFKNLKAKIVVCCESTTRKTKDDVLILPYSKFSQMLWSGEII